MNFSEQIINDILKFSSDSTFELTEEQKNKIKEIDKEFAKNKELVKSKFDEVKKKNDEYIAKIKEILKLVLSPAAIDSLSSTILVYVNFFKSASKERIDSSDFQAFIHNYLNDEMFSKEILESVENKGKLEDLEYYEAKIIKNRPEVEVTHTYVLLQVHDIKKDLEEVLTDVLKKPVTITEREKGNVFTLSYKKTPYALYCRLLPNKHYPNKDISLLEQVEAILDKIKEKEEKDSKAVNEKVYNIFNDQKFKDLMDKYNLEDTTRTTEKLKGGFTLKFKDKESQISLTSTGNVSYKPLNSKATLITSTWHTEPEWTKEDYYPIIDKIDAYMQKKLKKQQGV